MKNQILFRLSLTCVLLLLSVCFVKAQWSARTFANGITVATKTEVTPLNSQNSPLNTYEKPAISGNIIYRIFKDEKNKIYFGYDLEVKEATEQGKYTISIKPLSSESAKKSAGVENFKAKTLPKYPDAIVVNEGDIVSFNIMENPATREKIVDYIKVFSKPAPLIDLFPERTPIRDFTINDVELKIINFEFFADDKSILKVGGGASGSVLNLYKKAEGNFIFSLLPRKGYDFQKIGAVEGNKIFFKYKGIDYKIVSSEPIVGNGGHWNLWVLYDPNYKPTFGGDHEVGGAEDMIKSQK